MSMKKGFKLIEPSIGGSDGQLNVAAPAYCCALVQAVGVRSPKASYCFCGMITDETANPYDSAALANNPIAGFGFRNATKWAAWALPANGLNSGKVMFIVNEENVIYKGGLLQTYTCTYSTATGVAPTNCTV